MRTWTVCLSALCALSLLACAGPPPVRTEPTSAPDTMSAPDTTPAPDTAPRADVAADVFLGNGFQISGSVRDVTPECVVRFTSPLFDGEHAVPLGVLKRIQMRASLSVTGKDVLTLTTGDVLRGRVEAVTADSVTFHSAALSRVNLPRSAVASIRWDGKADTLLATDFAAGQTVPWTRIVIIKPKTPVDLRAADVAVADKKGYWIRGQVEHAGDVTLAVEILRAPTAKNSWGMQFFIPSQLRDGVLLQKSSDDALLLSVSARRVEVSYVGGGALLRVKLPGQAKGESSRIRLRIIRSTERKSISLWLNGKHVGEARLKLQKPLPSGSFITIGSGPGWGLRRLTVMGATMPPVDAADAPGPGAEALVLIYGGRRINAGSLTMRDGRLAIATTDGPLAMSREEVGAVVFNRVKGIGRTPGYASVSTCDGDLTLKLTQMTATHLLGTSPALGAVRVRRAAVSTLRIGGSIAGKAGADTVTLADGRKMSCRALSVDEQCRLRFQAPWLKGDGVLSADAVKALHLAGGVPEKDGFDLVALTNGDILVGKLRGLTADELDFETGLFGPHTLSTPIIATLTHGEAMARVKADTTNFASGEMGPWKPHVGKWFVDKGWLTATSPRHPGDGPRVAALAAEVDQSKGITVEVDMDASMRRKGFEYRIILFADALEGQWGNEHIQVALKPYGLNIFHCTVDGHRLLLRGRMMGFISGTKPFKGKLRVAYDPKSAKLVAWFDGEKVAECIVPQTAKVGRYVMISHHARLRTRRARILRGFVPPEIVAQEPAPDLFRLLAANGDKFEARSVTIEEGVVTAMSPDGEMRLPLVRVAQFKFPAKTRKAPPGTGHDAVVNTGRGRLTFKLTALTSEYLIGHSTLLGPIKLPRKQVHSLEFNF